MDLTELHEKNKEELVFVFYGYKLVNVLVLYCSRRISMIIQF